MSGMKIIDWLLETPKKRRFMVLVIVMILCLIQLYHETSFGAAILKCTKTADVIDLTRTDVYYRSFLGRLFFNAVQYSVTDGFIWSLLTHTVSFWNIMLVILIAAYLSDEGRDDLYEKGRRILFMMIVIFLLKSGMFAFAAYRAFSSTDTAIGLERLHTAGAILTYGSIITMIFILIELFVSLYGMITDSHKNG